MLKFSKIEPHAMVPGWSFYYSAQTWHFNLQDLVAGQCKNSVAKFRVLLVFLSCVDTARLRGSQYRLFLEKHLAIQALVDL